MFPKYSYFFTYQLVDIWFASAYYVFETGKARAFPAGLKMKASAGNSASRATAICAGSYPCERTDQGGCQGTVRFFFQSISVHVLSPRKLA